MRLCVSIPCFFSGMDFTQIVKTVSEIGYDAVELYGWKELDFDEVKEACNKYKVELLSMCTTEFCMTDIENKQNYLDALKESCDAAEKMGVRKLITQVGNDTGKPREEQHSSIVEILKEAVPILEKSSVTLMIEPLNTYVNHPGYYLWSSAEAFEIVREVSSPYVKVVFDIYHQQVMEGNIIPNITNNLDCIAHLHAAGHPGRNELQFGENDYKVIFSAVDKAGYKGACGLEYSPLMPAIESLKEAQRIYG